ncbi:MAG: phosphate ABC transporter substrate-binding protein PstS [Alphaproteobacteria bacterium]
MKTSKTWTRRIIGGALAGLVVGGAVAAFAAEFTGAGATFPAPVYTRWAEQYSTSSGDRLNYQAIGSGAGVTQILNRTVDFGASDAAVAPERLQSQNLLQFPAVIGGVVLAVNIPGVDGNSLKLNGQVLGDIYLCRIRMWNDKAIAALNPGVTLTALAVAPVYRSDSSGTTNIFTSYLSAVNLPFSTGLGAGNSVAWRCGIGAPGNAGVAGGIRNTRGAIGYVEYAYAVENNMQTPQLQNKSGQFVKPSAAGFAAAASTVNWTNAPNMQVSMNNTTGAANWPIVGPTYILLPKNPTDAAASLRVMNFFDWAFKNGKPAADQLRYVMLPTAVQDQVRQKWCQVKDTGGKAIWSGCK